MACLSNTHRAPAWRIENDGPTRASRRLAPARHHADWPTRASRVARHHTGRPTRASGRLEMARQHAEQQTHAARRPDITQIGSRAPAPLRAAPCASITVTQLKLLSRPPPPRVVAELRRSQPDSRQLAQSHAHSPDSISAKTAWPVELQLGTVAAERPRLGCTPVAAAQRQAVASCS